MPAVSSYKFDNLNGTPFLKEVSGTHCIPSSTIINSMAKTLHLFANVFLKGGFWKSSMINQGRVAALKKPHPETGKPFRSKAISL